MKQWLFLAILLAVFYLIYQIAVTFQLSVAAKSDEKNEEKKANRVNAGLMIVFLILGLIGVYWCNAYMYPMTLLNFPSASEEGELVDTMLIVTISVTGAVFFVTQILLFYFAWKYQHKEGRRSIHFAHSNKLELIWTTIPAIALTILIGFGVRYWYQITIDSPRDAAVVEVTGKQFGWIFRYPGKDGKLGGRYYRNIDDANLNPLGQFWNDPFNHDDIVSDNEVHLVVGQPVRFQIVSRDVIHDVGLSQFRLKMDAVPGIPTELTFTPKYTTKQMQEITKNPNFVYEISCDQMCGSGHYSMKGIIVVETKEEYDAWLAKQKSRYEMVSEQGMIPQNKLVDSASITSNNQKL